MSTLEIVNLAIGVLGIVLAVYAVLSQRKPNEELHALYEAIVTSPDLKIERNARGAITSVRVITGEGHVTIPGPRVSGTGTVTNPEA